jgi:hypothetical protein
MRCAARWSESGKETRAAAEGIMLKNEHRLLLLKEGAKLRDIL